MTAPVRLKLSRRKGFDLQALSIATNGLPAVNVARPSKWGNPFIVGKAVGAYTAKVIDLRHAWQLYASIAPDNERLVAAAQRELRGKNLACWCPKPMPYEPDCCHADVPLAIANRPICEAV